MFSKTFVLEKTDFSGFDFLQFLQANLSLLCEWQLVFKETSSLEGHLGEGIQEWT